MTKRKQTEKQATASCRNFFVLRIRGALAAVAALSTPQGHSLYEDNVLQAAWAADNSLKGLLKEIQNKDNWRSVTKQTNKKKQLRERSRNRFCNPTIKE